MKDKMEELAVGDIITSASTHFYNKWFGVVTKVKNEKEGRCQGIANFINPEALEDTDQRYARNSVMKLTPIGVFKFRIRKALVDRGVPAQDIPIPFDD